MRHTILILLSGLLFLFLVACGPLFAPGPKSPSGQTCCIHCDSGKPCGDRCISRSRACYQATGCACYSRR